MKLIALTCTQCGAPQDIDFGRSDATCEYCTARLQIERDAVSAATGASSPRSPNGRDQDGQLAELDREWETYRATYLTLREDGTYDVPTEDECRYAIKITVGISLVLIIAAAYWSLPVALVVGVFTAFILVRLGHQLRLGRVYQRSLQNYRLERRRILDQR